MDITIPLQRYPSSNQSNQIILNLINILINFNKPLQICIAPTISIGRESWCLPYAGFFYPIGISTFHNSNEALSLKPQEVKAKYQRFIKYV